MNSRAEESQRVLPVRVLMPWRCKRRQTSRRESRSWPTQAKIELHHPGLLQDDLVACFAAPFGFANVAVAVGGLREDADPALTGGVLLAAAGAFHDFRPLILGNDALDLQQQIVLGALSEGAIEEDDLHPGSRSSSMSRYCRAKFRARRSGART